MKNRIKILEETILYKGWSTLKRYIIRYTRSDGKVETHRREIYDSGDGAAVLLYNLDQKTIILIRQFRLPALLNGHQDGFIIECCAGLLDDKNPEETIIKEVSEETGYTITDVTKIYEGFATPGAHKEKIHFFVAQYNPDNKDSNGGGDRSEQEDIEVLEYNFDQIIDLLSNGDIVDSKTIILLQWAVINLLGRG